MVNLGQKSGNKKYWFTKGKKPIKACVPVSLTFFESLILACFFVPFRWQELPIFGKTIFFVWNALIFENFQNCLFSIYTEGCSYILKVNCQYIYHFKMSYLRKWYALERALNDSGFEPLFSIFLLSNILSMILNC